MVKTRTDIEPNILIHVHKKQRKTRGTSVWSEYHNTGLLGDKMVSMAEKFLWKESVVLHSSTPSLIKICPMELEISQKSNVCIFDWRFRESSWNSLPWSPSFMKYQMGKTVYNPENAYQKVKSLSYTSAKWFSSKI